MDCDKLNRILKEAGQPAMDVETHKDFKRWMKRRDRAGGEESTLDPEDYAELYVELHEVYLLSDDYAEHVIQQRRDVQARLDAGDWDSDEAFLELHGKFEELRKKTKEMGFPESDFK